MQDLEISANLEGLKNLLVLASEDRQKGFLEQIVKIKKAKNVQYFQKEAVIGLYLELSNNVIETDRELRSQLMSKYNVDELYFYDSIGYEKSGKLFLMVDRTKKHAKSMEKKSNEESNKSEPELEIVHDKNDN